MSFNKKNYIQIRDMVTLHVSITLYRMYIKCLCKFNLITLNIHATEAHCKRHIIIIIIIFLHGLGHLTCSGIDALPSFPGASAIPSSPGLVGKGIFRKCCVVHSFEVVDPVLFVFESHILYSRDL